MPRAGWLGMGDGMVGKHLAQPQQCNVPSGAADGQWLPSFFSASGRNERKASYQVPIPLSIPLPHRIPQSAEDPQPCQGVGSSQNVQLDMQLVPKPAAKRQLPAKPSFSNLR